MKKMNLEEILNRLFTLLKEKEDISRKALVLKFFIIIAILLAVFFSSDYHKQLLSWVSMIFAFIGTLILRKHFMPFTFIAILSYLLAITQEFWNASYEYLPITKFLWSAGNIFLPVGIMHFIYRLLFKYHIVSYEGVTDNK